MANVNEEVMEKMEKAADEVIEMADQKNEVLRIFGYAGACGLLIFGTAGVIHFAKQLWNDHKTRKAAKEFDEVAEEEELN